MASIKHFEACMKATQDARVPAKLSPSEDSNADDRNTSTTTGFPQTINHSIILGSNRILSSSEDSLLASAAIHRDSFGIKRLHQNFYEENDGTHNRNACGLKSYHDEDRNRVYFLGRLLLGILRHRALELGLKIRSDGYVAVKDLLKLDVKTVGGVPLSSYNVDDIKKAVEQDSKQRFGLLTEDGILFIRAHQGHSIKAVESDKLLKPINSHDEVPACVHGTVLRKLDSILSAGLKRMERNHVHFAIGLPKEDGVISGMKFNTEVVIYLDLKKAMQDGMKFYISDNKVILTEGFDGVVPPTYFGQVARLTKGQVIPMTVEKEDS